MPNARFRAVNISSFIPPIYVPLSGQRVFYSTLICISILSDYANYPPGPVNFVFDDRMLKHQPRAGTHERPERPERLIEIREMFASSGLDQRCIETVVSANSFFVDLIYCQKEE